MARRARVGAAGALAVLCCVVLDTAAQQPATRVAAATRPPVQTARPDVVWRVAVAGLDAGDAAALYSAFSPDGRVVGLIRPSRSVRLLDAADGTLLERIAADSTRRLSYSMAIANTGRVAVGRPGSMQIHEVARGEPIALFPCAASPCPPTSLAFSPDGSLLAVHDVVPFTPGSRRELGSVRVVDLRIDAPTRMQASTGLERLTFASAPAVSGEPGAGDGFRIWHTSDWELPRNMLGNGWTVGAVPSDAARDPTLLVAVYRTGTSVAMRDFETDRLLWAAPLLRPPSESGATRRELRHVEVAPNGRFLVGYESPAASDAATRAAGAIVVRRTVDGAVVEAYEVAGVSDLAIAPDSDTFLYTATTGGRTHAALVRVPAL